MPIVPGTTDPVKDVDAARKVIDKDIGYPIAVKAAGGGGGKGFRVARLRGRAREGVRGAPRARARSSSPTHGLHRALPARPAPRRGPGARRLARQRGPPVRARLLGAAAPPEADRGEPAPAVDAELRERIGKIGTEAAKAVGLPLGGHDRGPAPGRRVLLPRDEHARAGRALRDRDGHRHRHRAGADADRRRRGALVRPGRRRAPRPRDRVPHQRRGRLEEVRAGAGLDPPTASRRGRACASTRASRRATRSRRSTTR